MSAKSIVRLVPPQVVPLPRRPLADVVAVNPAPKVKLPESTLAPREVASTGAALYQSVELLPAKLHVARMSACATEAIATIANAIINFFIVVSLLFIYLFKAPEGISSFLNTPSFIAQTSKGGKVFSAVFFHTVLPV